jgi:hypothetical protein
MKLKPCTLPETYVPILDRLKACLPTLQAGECLRFSQLEEEWHTDPQTLRRASLKLPAGSTATVRFPGHKVPETVFVNPAAQTNPKPSKRHACRK